LKKKKLKVCQVCAVDFTLKTFLLPLIDSQIIRGCEVISVCSYGNNIKNLRDKGYEIKIIKFSRSFNVLSHLKSVWFLLRYFQKESFDVIHVHTPVVSLIARLAGYLAKTPCVVYTAHGFYFHENMSSLKRAFFIGLEKVAGNETDVLFTQSQEDAESAVQLGIMKGDKTFPIGNGVDIKKFSNAYSERNSLFAFPPNGFVIGMVGRLVEEKGVVDFIEAALIASKANSNTYFMLVGSKLESDHSNSVLDKIESCRLQLGDRLILTGLRDDIPEILSCMNAFCLPSWREGMPRTIIEAMVSQLPVIATDIRGSREEVVHRETGILVPCRSPAILAKAMCELADNPSLSKQMGLAGRRRALKLYDESKVIKYQLDIIDALLKTKSFPVY
jgi:glycosyltransferase involved in cell wall biosynthesis